MLTKTPLMRAATPQEKHAFAEAERGGQSPRIAGQRHLFATKRSDLSFSTALAE